MKEKMMEVLKGGFRPEFLDRIAEIVILLKLSEELLRRIVDTQLHRLKQIITKKRTTIEFDDAVKEQLAKEGYDAVFGARPLKRVIHKRLLDTLAGRIIASDIKEGQKLKATLSRSGQVRFIARA